MEGPYGHIIVDGVIICISQLRYAIFANARQAAVDIVFQNGIFCINAADGVHCLRLCTVGIGNPLLIAAAAAISVVC